MPQPESVRDAAFYLWDNYLHTPYRWAGNDPLDGVDCSGLVLAGLQGVGVLPSHQDYTADALLKQVFASKTHVTSPTQLRRGMLVFYGAPRVTHVEIVWAVYPNGTILALGASGGDRRTTTRAAAVAMDAFVKIAPLRPGFVAAVDPFL